MKPIIKDPKKRAKAKKALRVVAAISTSGGSEVARAKMKIAQKAAGAVVDKMQKKNGGMAKKRTMYKDGGMTKAKPC